MTDAFWGRVRLRVFGISPEEARVDRRGFRGVDPGIGRRLEAIGRTFIHGYRAGLVEDRAEALAARLRRVQPELQGFAFEGAAMALTLLDQLVPGKGTRFSRFVAGPGADHTYMLHVGAGWAFARLKRDPRRFLRTLDPLLGWLVLDGYGFHEGYFHWPASIDRRKRPRRLRGYALRVFDQGLGRSLWFVRGADPEKIGRTIESFPLERRRDLWSGVGLAAAYADGVGEETLKTLRSRGTAYAAELAQGAAFAAKARQRAGHVPAPTESACEILCGAGAAEAAAVTDAALEGIAPTGSVPAYEVWRTRIRERLREARNVGHAGIAGSTGGAGRAGDIGNVGDARDTARGSSPANRSPRRAEAEA